MFYTLKINALKTSRMADKPGHAVTVKFNKDASHGKIHFVALDHRMASNIYYRQTGILHDSNYQIEVACYDNSEDIVYMNTKEIILKHPA